MKFKKITAIAGSVLMTGLTVASAAAAAFPMPFVDNGKADVAIVYGADADLVAANNVHTALGKFVTSTGATTVTGGDVFILEKSSDKMNFGDNMNSIYATLDDDEMPIMLAEGDYDDGDADTEYKQKVTLKANPLTLFKDNDYNDDEPTIGFDFSKGTAVLDYEIDFDDAQSYSVIEGTDMPLMGKEYFVLDADTTADPGIIKLLDSASTTIISEGETVTVDGKTISVIIGEDWAKFTVDGEIIDKLEDGQDKELADESYIAVKEVLYQSKETAVSSVEFTIGEGKMVLESGQEVEMNDEDVDGLVVTLTGTGTGATQKLDKITLAWETDEDEWLTPEDSLEMPGFKAIKLAFEEMDFPSSELISFDSGDELTIDMEDFDLPILRTNGTVIEGLGETNNPLIVGTAPETAVNLTEDDRFILTIIPTGKDLSDAETKYLEVSKIENDTGDIVIEFEDLIGTSDITLDDMDDSDEGDFVFDPLTIADDAWVNMQFTSNIGTVYMDKVVTSKGLTIQLPYEGSSTAPAINFTTLPTSYVFTLTEADDDENINSGTQFTVSTSVDTGESKMEATDTNQTELETTSDDQYVAYIASELATKIEKDTSSDLSKIELMYYGEEVMGEVAIASSDAVISTAAAADFLPVKASEIDNVKSKNLVIVGGSCVNAAAATLLGGALCGEAFTAATGVSAGQFVIEEYMDAFTTGKTALLVAGYEQADTVNAVTYLTKMEDVDTSTKMVKGVESVTDLA